MSIQKTLLNFGILLKATYTGSPKPRNRKVSKQTLLMCKTLKELH